MIDYLLALQTGADIPIPECQLVAHQPTLKEISMCGEQEYLSSCGLITVSKDILPIEDENVLSNINNFQIFMTAMLDERLSKKRSSFIKVLGIVFPNYKINFTPNSIFLKQGEQLVTIDKNNFDAFQQTLIDIFCLGKQQSQTNGFNPKGKKGKEIAEKLMKARQKVAKEKGLENSSVLGQQISCLAIGQNIPLTTIVNYTLYQILDQMERYQLYITWDLDIRSRLAGAKPTKELENWMKVLH